MKRWDLDVVRRRVAEMRGRNKKFYHSVLFVQMKNWEPLVFGPEFAIESVPATTNKKENTLNVIQ